MDTVWRVAGSGFDSGGGAAAATFTRSFGRSTLRVDQNLCATAGDAPSGRPANPCRLAVALGVSMVPLGLDFEGMW